MALTDMVLMPGADYQGICDQTRRLTGETGTLKSGEVVTKLSGVPTGGSVDMRTINITVDGQGVSDIEDWAVSCSYGTNDLTLDSGTPSASISVPNQTIFVIYISPDMLVDVSGIDEAIMFDVLGVSGSYAHLTEFPDLFIYVCRLNATGGNSSFTLALSLSKNPNYL